MVHLIGSDIESGGEETGNVLKVKKELIVVLSLGLVDFILDTCAVLIIGLLLKVLEVVEGDLF